MLDFSQKFFVLRQKNSIGDLSKCRVYTEIGYENRYRLAMNGKSTNR